MAQHCINKYFGTVDIQLIDITGRKIYSVEKVEILMEKYRPSNVNPGIYLLKVTGDSLNLWRKSF
jgi:hypothetical protein